MKVNRKELLSKLQRVSVGVSKRPIIEQSDCFVFLGGRVYTFNDLVFCSAECEVGFDGAVVHDKLLPLLKNLSHEELEITADGRTLRVEAPGDKAEIAMQAGVELPVSGVEEPEEWLKLPDGFWDGVSVVQSCCSDNRRPLTCVHICRGWVEAGDGFQISRFYVDPLLDQSILIGRDSIKSLVGFGLDRMSVTEKWVHFSDENDTVFSCQRYLGEYPDFGPYFDFTGEEWKLPKVLGDVISSAEVCDGDGYLEVDLSSDRMKVVGKSGMSKYEGVRECSWSGSPIRFGVPSDVLWEISKQGAVFIGGNCLKVKTDRFEYVTTVAFPEGEK